VNNNRTELKKSKSAGLSAHHLMVICPCLSVPTHCVSLSLNICYFCCSWRFSTRLPALPCGQH